MNITIQSMEEKYLDSALELVRQVFTDHENEKEGRLVRRLAEEIRSKRFYLPQLEIIAVDEGDEVVGYAMFSRFHLEGRYEDRLLLLSPVAVKTQLQRQHISKRMIEYGFEQARKLGFEAAIVEGNPANYRARGFVTAAEYGILPGKTLHLPAIECLMVKELRAGALESVSGTVEYSDYAALTEGGRALNAEKYRSLMSKETMMGPNTIRLLGEIMDRYPLNTAGRIMDLGCGAGLSSLYLARETGAKVFAVDLWCSATDNFRRFQNWNADDQIIPIHANALDLPFADEYFDAVVSVDAYHYFACNPEYFGEKLLPLVKDGGTVLIVVPGLKEEFDGEVPLEILEWAGEEYALFHSCQWWRKTIGEHPFVAAAEFVQMECGDIAWREWFDSGHEYALRDKAFFDKGIGKYLNFVGMAIRKK